MGRNTSEICGRGDHSRDQAPLAREPQGKGHSYSSPWVKIESFSKGNSGQEEARAEP